MMTTMPQAMPRAMLGALHQASRKHSPRHRLRHAASNAWRNASSYARTYERTYLRTLFKPWVDLSRNVSRAKCATIHPCPDPTTPLRARLTDRHRPCRQAVDELAALVTAERDRQRRAVAAIRSEIHELGYDDAWRIRRRLRDIADSLEGPAPNRLTGPDPSRSPVTPDPPWIDCGTPTCTSCWLQRHDGHNVRKRHANGTFTATCHDCGTRYDPDLSTPQAPTNPSADHHG